MSVYDKAIDTRSKVGIITFYYRNYNYGGMLQAYALQKTIQSMGYKCEQISLLRNYELSIGIKNRIRNIYWFIKRMPLNFVTAKRNRRFKKFQGEIPHSSIIYDCNTIQESNQIYDIFVCGSDQIWNDWNQSEKEIDCNTLFFVNENKVKISYAASAGRMNFGDNFKNSISRGIRRLQYISVREHSSVELISKISKKKIEVVLDPVLLLEQESWKQLCSNNSYKEPYVLCYLLGNDKAIEDSAIRFAKEYGLRIIILPFDNKIRINSDKKCYYDYSAGPKEFLTLIRYAEFILTDSFHAMMFSVIFHKEFYVFLRQTMVQGQTMNSRVMDFLQEFAINHRIITGDKLKREVIQYDPIWEKINTRKQESIKFLMNALSQFD